MNVVKPRGQQVASNVVRFILAAAVGIATGRSLGVTSELLRISNSCPLILDLLLSALHHPSQNTLTGAIFHLHTMRPGI